MSNPTRITENGDQHAIDLKVAAAISPVINIVGTPAADGTALVNLQAAGDAVAIIANTASVTTLATTDLAIANDTTIAEAGNVILGTTTGTQIGTGATQKLGFYGKTPVVQAGAITTPTTVSSSFNQTELATLKTAIDAIRVALINLGLTA